MVGGGKTNRYFFRTESATKFVKISSNAHWSPRGDWCSFLSKGHQPVKTVLLLNNVHFSRPMTSPSPPSDWMNTGFARTMSCSGLYTQQVLFFYYWDVKSRGSGTGNSSLTVYYGDVFPPPLWRKRASSHRLLKENKSTKVSDLSGKSPGGRCEAR